SPETNSPALTTLFTILLQAFYHSGRLFTAENSGLTSQLVRLFTEHGMQDIQTRSYTQVHRTGTASAQHASEDAKQIFRLLVPFFGKWVRLPSDYEHIYQQALKDMQQPAFTSTSTLLTVWGIRPDNGGPLLMRGLP